MPLLPVFAANESWRRAALVASAVLALVGVVLVFCPTPKGPEASSPPRILLAGQDVAIGEGAIVGGVAGQVAGAVAGALGNAQAPEAAGVEAVRRYAQGAIALVLPLGEKIERRSVSRAVLGAEIDRVRLGALLA